MACVTWITLHNRSCSRARLIQPSWPVSGARLSVARSGCSYLGHLQLIHFGSQSVARLDRAADTKSVVQLQVCVWLDTIVSPFCVSKKKKSVARLDWAATLNRLFGLTCVLGRVALVTWRIWYAHDLIFFSVSLNRRSIYEEKRPYKLKSL
jgi:hypothetical protein